MTSKPSQKPPQKILKTPPLGAMGGLEPQTSTSQFSNLKPHKAQKPQVSNLKPQIFNPELSNLKSQNLKPQN